MSTTLFSKASAKDGKIHALKPAGEKLWHRKTLCGKDFGLTVTTQPVTCPVCLKAAK